MEGGGGNEGKKRGSLKKRFEEFENNYVVPLFKKPNAETFTYEMVEPTKQQSKD